MSRIIRLVLSSYHTQNNILLYTGYRLYTVINSIRTYFLILKMIETILVRFEGGEDRSTAKLIGYLSKLTDFERFW